MTSDPGLTGPQDTPIYEDLVQEQGDVLADSRAAAEAARQETSAAMDWPRPHRTPEGDGPATVTDTGPGGSAHFA